MQGAVQVGDVVLAPYQPGAPQNALVGLLYEVLGVLARAAQRPGRPEQPVEVITERVWIKGAVQPRG